MKENTYNGWANRSTWNTILWIRNDQSMSAYVAEFAAGKSRIANSDARSICAELFPSGSTPDGDKICDANMTEIAEHLTDVFCG